MMNLNGKLSKEKESVINIGLHVKAIDEDGNWSEAEIINIIDNNLILKFLDKLETYNRIIDISSNKWHHIDNSKSDQYTFHNKDFEKGDFVLAKWNDGNYYLSQILDITTKTKFGTKVKEYHILYLYDNMHAIVPLSCLKCPNSSSDNDSDLKNPTANNKEVITINKPPRRTYKRRSEALDCHENDNVFYDEKTKRFTENCKLRRLKLSNKNGGNDNYAATIPDVTVPNVITAINSPPVSHRLETKIDVVPVQRYSQRKRRSPYKKADYFYPDSIDSMLKEKNRSSTNNSQVSTPVPFEINEEFTANSPKITWPYSMETKDCAQSSNHSPISVSLTSTEYSPHLRHKADNLLQIFEEDDVDLQGLYKINEDGKYQCLICTNKTFRKKQVVCDHIKHYHPTINDQSNEQFLPKVTKTVYSPNKRYYSSYLKVKRTSMGRKKKYNKSKIKSLIKGNTWTKYTNRNHKSDYRFPSLSDVKRGVTPNIGVSGSGQSTNNSIIYCHRCKKCSDNGHMVQCDVCLCWSHSACYNLSDNKDTDSFWECDNCSNHTGVVLDGTKTAAWYRDRCKFHSIPRNELPWLTKNATMVSPCNIRNICEIQSFLSLSQRILDAIRKHMDKLTFKSCNDSNSQDDLDILKNLYVYDNIDEINITKIDTDPLSLNVDNDDDIFRTTNIPEPCQSALKSSTTCPSSSAPDFIFNEATFSNSTPNKMSNGHKLANVSFDGILDCEIQKLDILPKAAFDALIDDLNLSDDICKVSNLESLSKSNILDLFDDNIKVNNRKTASSVQLSSLFRGHDIDGTVPMMDISTEDITSLLLDKLPHRSSTMNDDVCTEDNQPSKDIGSLNPSTSNIQHTVTNNLSHTLGHNDWCYALHSDNKAISTTSHTCTTQVDTDLHLSNTDRQCLAWLVSKYKSVERIVECIEETLLASSASDEILLNDNNDDDYHEIGRYLHSLLYILKQD